MNSRAASGNAAGSSSGDYVNPARCDSAFNEIIARVEAAIVGRLPPLLDYAPRAVEKRLTQKLVQLGLPPFQRWIARRPDDWEPAALDPAARLNLDGIRIEGGRVGVSVWLWVRSYGTFAVHWLALLIWSLLLTFSRHRPARSSFTLLFGLALTDIVHRGNDARLVEFCRRGPIEPLNRASCLIAQVSRPLPSTAPGYVTYTRRPWFAAMQRSRWDARSLLGFVGEHLLAAAAFTRAALARGPLVLLAHDFAYHAPARALDRTGLIENVVTTCSSYNEQFLWMNDLPDRRFEFHMIWYSMSTFPKIFRHDPVRTVLPDLLHMRDEHSWVWTEGQAAMLREWGAAGHIHVVGPILLYLPESSPAPGREKRIVVFDVTPLDTETLARVGRINNYYSRDTVQNFIADIVEARDSVEDAGTPIKLVVKPKRVYSDFHDQGYVDSIKRHAGTARHFELIEPDTNMFALIAGCDLVITIPYSSPAYVAAALEVPAIYYDPTRQLVPAHEPSPFITFVSGPEALAQALLRHVRGGPEPAAADRDAAHRDRRDGTMRRPRG